MHSSLRNLLVAFAAVTTLTMVGAFAADDGMGWMPTKPGAEHAVLKKLEGSFTTTFHLRAPGAPAIVSEGNAKGSLVHGLWLVGEYHDPNYMGGSFEGHSMLGYDTAKKKYVGAWIDSTDSSMQTSEGTYDEATQTLTMLSDGRDPYTGKPTKDRTITHFVDKDHYSFSVRSKTEGKEEVEVFTIDYARK